MIEVNSVYKQGDDELSFEVLSLWSAVQAGSLS